MNKNINPTKLVGNTMKKESNICEIFRESISWLKEYLLDVYVKCPLEYGTEIIK